MENDKGIKRGKKAVNKYFRSELMCGKNGLEKFRFCISRI